MSNKQKVVYVRRAVSPRYDPDPDPDPIAIIPIAILAIIGVVGGTVLTNPNILNNILMMIDPKLKDIEEERIEAMKHVATAVAIVMVIVALLVLAYIFWRWNTQKKEAKRARLWRSRAFRNSQR